MYLIAARLFENKILAVLSTAAWALSIGAMSSAVFIRMYAMLTFFSVLLVYLHIRTEEYIHDHKTGGYTYILLWLCTTLGILTQYYFLVFCFFVCGCFCLYLLARKAWRELMRYVAAEVGAIATAIILFPSMLRHIFRSYRGTEAFSNLSDSETFSSHLTTVLSILSKRLLNGWAKELLFLIIAAMIIYALKRRLDQVTISSKENTGAVTFHIRKETRTEKTVSLSCQSIIITVLSVVVMGYILTIAKIAPYQTDRYYMCVFPFIPLIFVYVTRRAVLLFTTCNKAVDCAIIVFFVLCLGLSYRMQSVEYLYSSYQNRDILEEYSEYPIIIINGATYNGAPDQFMTEYVGSPAVYRCRCNDLSGLDKAVDSYDLDEGFLLYTVDYSAKNEDELFAQIQESVELASHECIVTSGAPVYFCTLKS